MIIRSLNDILGTDHDVSGEGWLSRRLLTRRDGMGYSLHDTTVLAGAEMTLWYKNHFEACYCVEGAGEVENLATGEVHAITPGTVYALDQNDKHILRASADMRLICVFNPPLTGRETHDDEGTYPVLED